MLNNNQNKENVNVNTKGLVFKNSSGFEPSVLALGCWNDMLSIKIHPALEKSKQTENRLFNYEEAVATALSVQKAKAFATKIEEIILPAIANDENKTVSVPVGGDSLISVGTGKAITGKIRPYLAIHKTLDEKTKKPEFSIFYEFVKEKIVEDYDPSTGNLNMGPEIHAELLVFINILKKADEGFSNVIAHTIRFVDKYFRDKSMNILTEIGNKMGVATSNSYGKGNYKKKDIFSGMGEDYSNNESQKAESLSNIEEIDSFIN